MNKLFLYKSDLYSWSSSNAFCNIEELEGSICYLRELATFMYMFDQTCIICQVWS